MNFLYSVFFISDTPFAKSTSYVLILVSLGNTRILWRDNQCIGRYRNLYCNDKFTGG